MKHPFITIENKDNVAQLRIIGSISNWENDSETFTKMIDQVLVAGATSLEAYINCFGGSMIEANEIGNQIQRFSGLKTCKIGAIAASAGAYITTYFDKVILSSNTQFMIHDPSVEIFISRLEDFDSNKKLYVNLRNDVIARFVKRTKISTEAMSAMMNATTWMNATETKEKGFADEILNEEAILPADASNIFKNYTNLPANIVAQINNSQTPKNMKKLFLALGIAENATEDQAIEALNALKQIGINAITALGETKNLKKETIQKLANTNAVSAFEFVNEFEVPTIPSKETPELDADGKVIPPVVPTTSPNDLVKVLENHLKGGGGNSPKKLNDYSPAELEELAEKEPAVYDALMKTTYKFK